MQQERYIVWTKEKLLSTYQRQRETIELISLISQTAHI